METYKLHVAGLERDLPICPLNDNLSIAGFVMFGDVEMTIRSAEELLKRVGDFDLLITAESKGIPLAYEMARQAVPISVMSSPTKQKSWDSCTSFTTQS